MLLAVPSPSSGQVTTFIAQKVIIDGKNFTVSVEVDDLRLRMSQVAKSSPEKWSEAAQAVFMNMVFATAAQVATAKGVGDGGALQLPVRIRQSDLMAALLVWDTALDNDCTTPERIAKGDGRWPDILLFSGDYEKLQKISGSGFTAGMRDRAAFRSMLGEVEKKIPASGRYALVEPAVRTGYTRLQHFLLGVKFELVWAKDVESLVSSVQKLAEELKLRP
jgi:hypothetical protein